MCCIIPQVEAIPQLTVIEVKTSSVSIALYIALGVAIGVIVGLIFYIITTGFTGRSCALLG